MVGHRPKMGISAVKVGRKHVGFGGAKSDVSQQIMGASHSATDKKLKGEPQNKSVSVPKAMVSQAT